MAMSVADIVEYKGFKILPVLSGDGYFARIKRADGRPFSVDGQTREHFDTMKYSDDAASIEQAKLIVDSGAFQ
jgi:hypothetical protein